MTPARLEERSTTAPPAGASQSRVTVPAEELPAVTVSGASARPVTAGFGLVGLTEAESVACEDPSVAVTVTDEDRQQRVATPKRALDEPEGTETVGGTVRTRGLLLCRATGVSAGAGTSRDTRFELKVLGPVKHCLSRATRLDARGADDAELRC